MAQRSYGTDTDNGQRDNGATMKRRGILRAAGMALGAVAANIAAKQTSQPVAAGGSQGNALILGGAGFNAIGGNTETSTTWVVIGSPTVDNYDGSDAFLAASQFGDGVVGWGDGSGSGVYGRSRSGRGVSGFSLTGPGVYGESGGGGTGAGVVGAGSYSGGPGVVGRAATSSNVTNQSVNADGVQGFGTGTFSGVAGFGGASNGEGIFGLGGGSTGAGVVGVAAGAPNPGAGLKAGVYGSGGAGIGIYGSSSGNAGVFGTTTAAQNVGVGGLVSTPNTAAFAGTSTIPTAFAGFFTGDVLVNGNFTVIDPTKKHGAIAHPDGSYRVLYSMESPESWLEDFGKGTLANGKADVRLDPDFAAVAQTDDYYVFPVPHDPTCRGLAVVAQRRDSFVLQEMNGGTSSGAFRYRVVARPKTTNKATRLAKFTVPDIKVPQPPPMVTMPTMTALDSSPQPAPPSRLPAPAATSAVPQGNGATQGGATNPVQPAPPPRAG